MKKQIVKVVVLAVVALGGSLYAVHADPLAGMGCGRECDGSGQRLAKMAGVLDLSGEQQERIRAIVEDERSKTEPLREQLAENREQLRQLVHSGSFDEAAVRALAAKKAEAGTELMVVRARTESRIQAELTGEQRELAAKVRPLMEGQREGRAQERKGDCSARCGNCPKRAQL